MDYTIMELNKDILSAEELHFFYYDVMRDNINGAVVRTMIFKII